MVAICWLLYCCGVIFRSGSWLLRLGLPCDCCSVLFGWCCVEIGVCVSGVWVLGYFGKFDFLQDGVLCGLA